MNRLFVLLMIVLLPLRGLAGDLMSIEMTTSGTALHITGAMPGGCPMHLHARAAKSGVGSTQAPGDVKSCDSCQLCIPLADLAAAQLVTVSFAAHVTPLMGGVEFLSASPAPAFKPPIS